MSTNPFAYAPIDAVPVEATVVETPKKKSRIPIVFAVVAMGLAACTFSPTDLPDPAIVGAAEAQSRLVGQLSGYTIGGGIFGFGIGYMVKSVFAR